MKTSLPCPAAPDFPVDFEAWTAELPWLAAMRGCVQDAVHHAEGDVWIHTRAVCASLAGNPRWRELEPAARRRVFLAALLHDVGKPDCTQVGADGRVTARGHSERGAILARQLLWELEVPLREREAICGAIRFHQLPFFLVDREDSERKAFEVSCITRCDELALVTWADAAGRSCEDQQRLFDRIELFREYCAEKACLQHPRAFPSDHARFQYFRTPGRDPLHRPHEDFRCEVVLMSGMPGSGKDYWVNAHLSDWPRVSLDALRAEHDIEPDEPQGPLVQLAREAAREHLRAGRSFVWNATNLSRRIRGQCVDLFASYGARVRIVYVEAAADRLAEQNRSREGRVPAAVMRRLLDRWTVPDATEAHQVDWVSSGTSESALAESPPR